MTHQEQVTLEQVRCKVDEAKRRAERYMRLALDSKTEETYDTNITLMCQAASDYETWKKVLNSLNSLS